jgi:hypothetical protein
MFGEFKKDESISLDEIIKRILLEMEVYGPESDEFPSLLAYLERLEKIKTEKRRPRISLDTLVISGANILGIVLIISYEQKHVLVTKAKDFVMKLR